MRRYLQSNWLINNKDWIDKIRARLILTNETFFVVVLILNNDNNKKTRSGSGTRDEPLRTSAWEARTREVKEKKRKIPTFLFSFLWFNIKYSQNWECFHQSCLNRTESEHGTLRFLFLSRLSYGICVRIFIKGRYISKSYTISKKAIDQQHTERGERFLCRSHILALIFVDL